jgi:predicted nuclease of predicted toxin-antitoxin system
MRFLVDMNLSPSWLRILAAQGWEAKHWSSIGEGNEPDSVLLDWARTNRHILLTQDLDFPRILHATQASGPSVVLLRMDNEFDADGIKKVCIAMREASPMLESGALLTLTPKNARLRRLPVSES